MKLNLITDIVYSYSTACRQHRSERGFGCDQRGGGQCPIDQGTRIPEKVSPKDVYLDPHFAHCGCCAGSHYLCEREKMNLRINTV